MNAHVLNSQWPDSTPWPDAIGFARLHRLAQRGYRPCFTARAEGNPKCLLLEHPRKSGKNVPPPLTLWSDGIITTTEVLWPAKYVPSADGPPDWQLFISPDEAARFESFAESIAQPNVFDLYWVPALKIAKRFAVHFIYGTALCVVIASALKLALYLI
jgi:hypothetical protein